MRRAKFIFILIFLISWVAHAQERCENIFLCPSSVFINKRIQNLAQLRLKLEISKTTGGSSMALTALKHDYLKKEQELVKYLRSEHAMTEIELQAKLKSEIRILQEKNTSPTEDDQKIERSKEAVREALKPSGVSDKMTFRSISPGHFLMGTAAHPVQIATPFQMMATPVTQMMYARILALTGETSADRLSPSHQKDGDDRWDGDMNGVNVTLLSSRPVERISWEMADHYVNILNRLSVSEDTKIQKQLSEIITHHRKGDNYALPTNAQWEYVMKNLGQAKNAYFDSETSTDMLNYGWFQENSEGETHAVATKIPRMIDGQEFYDLEGNVWEWTRDSLPPNFTGGVDPFYMGRTQKICRGGCFLNNVDGLTNNYQNLQNRDSMFFLYGFRLVRLRP